MLFSNLFLSMNSSTLLYLTSRSGHQRPFSFLLSFLRFTWMPSGSLGGLDPQLAALPFEAFLYLLNKKLMELKLFQ